ncbi:outer membrane protein transport protein (OMPP1/FadL/TodX) [Ulvibacter antarcticus]|uniref:Outer membrane protein transport protein (OMPP1/FadL/TodX) n=2 Tax=Ulvibacter antarcticus TaxID=442714 RepID=A0A3L9Y7W5_9FLAO|nr:outer membrane protein transport protein (OMPP1/FadL/TodX) [Ulvibacter antarcticus]
MAVTVMSFSNAQNISDGLRYSLDDSYGSARYNALSGAFGSLGGDLSAMSINPAGSAIFLNTSASISVSANDFENSTSYFNTNTKGIITDVNLNQAGAVFVFNNPSETSKLKKFSLGINYQSSRNYDDELYIFGDSNASVDQFFLAQAQGIPLDLLQLQSGESVSDLYAFLGENEGVFAQNAFLGYQGFIIDPLDPNDPSNTDYVSTIAPGTFHQEYAYITEGANNKFTINFATQLSSNFFLGINLNSHSIDYRQSSFLFEANNNIGSSVDQIGFENNLTVDGVGFSAQIGAIAKLTENFRLGLSLDTPTWYEISEETSQRLETRVIDDGNSSFVDVDPRVINIYENYQITTPGKVTASASYIFGTQGLISFDYSYKDYSAINFETGYNSFTDSSYFNDLNDAIENSLNGVSTFRLGGEYRINNLSLRGGLRYEESPYQNEITVGDLSGFSLGMGYNFGNYNFDISYARAEQDRKQRLYDIGLTNEASINTITTNIALSVGFKF